MNHQEKPNKEKWTEKDEEKYIEEIRNAAEQIATHKEEFGGYVAISADTLLTLIESHKTLKQIRNNN
jgi:Cu/Ag efflux pump CusA